MQHCLTLLLTGAIACGLAAVSYAGPTLYVSPEGDDAWSGSKEKPFRTLLRARDEIRKIKKAAGLPKGGVVVELMPGLYPLDKAFELTEEDSGTDVAPITYRAANRGTAVLSGGVVLANWQPVSNPDVLKRLDAKAKGKVVSTQLDAALLETIAGFANGGCGYRGKRDYPVALYQNGQRLPISRWPNDKHATMGECLGKSHIAGHVGIKFTDGVFRFDDPRLQRWVGEPDLWFDGLWFHHWADQKMQLKAIDLDARTISLKDPESHHFGFKKGQGFYAFNAISEIDRPGEWAVDRAKRSFYLWPSTDLQASAVTLALRENLVKAENLAHVIFDGLVFETCREDAVELKACKNVTLAACTLRHAGAWAVKIDGGEKDTVIGCDLYDLGEGGVYASGGDRDTLTPGRHLIENNHIHHFGRIVSTYRPGAAVYGVGNQIRHNLIYQAVHQAIYFNGNDHLIEYNIVHDVCLHSSDAGALYACTRDWSQRGTIIRHNLFHALGKGLDGCGCRAIYLDDYTSGTLVEGNIVTMSDHGVNLGGGQDNTVANNIAINCKCSSQLASRGIDSFAKANAAKGRESSMFTKLLAKENLYRAEPWKTRYPKLLAPLAMDAVEGHDAHGNIFRNNVNVGGGRMKIRNAKKVMKTCVVKNNIDLWDDPGFVNMASFDLRLREDAPVFKKIPGFRPIEFEKMGLYADPRRASPAVKFGPEVTPMPPIEPRIRTPERAPRYIIEEWSSSDVKLDGKAESKEWPKSQNPLLECANQVYGPPSKYPCTARIAFDGERLLMLVTVDIDPTKSLVTAGNWGGRDGLEIVFRDPTREDAGTYVLHGYPDGTFDLDCADTVPAPTANPPKDAVGYATTVAKERWTAEIVFRLPAFGIQLQTSRKLLFNLNIRRMCDKTWTVWTRPESGVTDLDSGGALILPRVVPETPEMEKRRAEAAPLFDAEKRGDLAWAQLDRMWKFRADPDNVGAREGWFKPELPTDDWQDMEARRSGQPMDAYEAYTGWGWCRKRIDVTADQLARPFCALLFPCIDEEGEVYINGKKAVEHTSRATGIAPGLLWRQPFLVDLRAAGVAPGNVDVAVRLRGNMGTGGIRKGVYLVCGAQAPPPAALYDFLATNTKLNDWDRPPQFWQDSARARIPAVPAAPDESSFGKKIQRTMDRLAASTAEKRNRVRILFYGQSITQGMHFREMVNVLRRRFPHAVIEVENRAIGGFTAPSLIRTAVHDLYPRDVDLVVFHVYGGEETGELEAIIAGMRKWNTSDIMVYTHHLAWMGDPDSLEQRSKGADISSDKMRELARKYNLELVEVREEWRQYLRTHDMGINELIGDTVHSNVHHNPEGHTLLAELVLRHFRHHPDNPVTHPDAARSVAATDAAVQVTGAWERTPQGTQTSEKGATLKLTFEGNRVDVIPFPYGNAGSATIRIDGKSPAEFPGLYYCSRTSEGPYIWMPAIKRVSLGEGIIPKIETWTLTPANVDTEKKTFTFRLEGSVTGFDGEGDNAHDFVSKSGRIRIEEKDFHILWPLSYRKKEYPADFKVTWEIRPLFVETWRPCTNPDPEVEDRVTLVKGLPNGRHTLEIVANGDGVLPIKEFRVHQPPLD